MNRIKAIVLTFDGYRPLTDHMIFKYQQLWPDHPFLFRVPYQDLANPPSERIEYRRTPVGIKQTVLGLLDDLDDHELIYWCIDDKYPMKLDVPRIAQIGQWLTDPSAASVSGVLFCRCRRMWDERCLGGDTITDPWGHDYLERTGYEQIWVHQFVRAGVIRHLFQSFPDVIEFPRRMDKFKNVLPKPAWHRLLVSRRNLATFGESTEQGTLTLNCRRSLARNGLTAPSWADETTTREHVLGTPWLNAKQRLRYYVGRLTGHPPDFFY